MIILKIIWFYTKLFGGLGLATVILLFLVSYVMHYHDNIKNGSTKMKWKDVKQLYRINPNRWNYDFNELILWYDETISVRLSLFGYTALTLHYILYTKRRNYSDKQHYDTTGLRYILETAQRDIDYLKQKAMNEVSTAVKIQEEIIERKQKDA